MILVQMKRDFTPHFNSEWQTSPPPLKAGSFHVVIETLEDGLIGRIYSPSQLTYVDLHYSYFRVCDRDWQTFRTPNLGREFRAEELAEAKKQLSNQVTVSPPEGVGRSTQPGEVAQDVAASPVEVETMIATNGKLDKEVKAKTAKVKDRPATIRMPTAEDELIALGLLSPRDTEKAVELSRESPSGKGWVRRVLEGATQRVIAANECTRHPDNRVPEAANVEKLAKSLITEGQTDPIVVRALSDSEYQILSGETRWLAARKNWGGTAELDARVIGIGVLTDAQAYELVVLFNAKRTDLNAIEKARAIKLLRDKYGKTWEQAGEPYDLTATAAQNLTAILNAPEIWQQRYLKPETIRDEEREVHQATLREIAKFAHVPAFLKDIEDDYRNGYWAGARDEQVERVRMSIKSVVRNPAEENTCQVEKNYHVSLDLLFDLKSHRAKLGIIKLPLGNKGEDVEVCTNVKLYDELQAEAYKQRQSKKASAAADRDKPKESKKELTPAELKARAKEQAERLEKRIRNWRHEWLRHLIAARLKVDSPYGIDHNVTSRLITYLMVERLSGHIPLWDIFRQRLKEHSANRGHLMWEVIAPLGEESLFQATIDSLHDLLLHEDATPDFPHWPRRVIEDVAAMLDIDLATEWKVLQTQGRASESSMDRYRSFFELHQADQLDILGKELGVYTEGAKTKALKVKMLAQCSRTLTLPKSIDVVESVNGAEGKKPAKKGKKVNA